MTQDNNKIKPDSQSLQMAVSGSVTCGIMAHNLSGHIDKHGCIKKEAHNDNHIFKDQNDKLISWEDDYSCECGCWDAYEKGDPDVCVLYHEIESKANAICLECGTAIEHPESGFCINGHDNWLEEEDNI